LKKFLCGEKGFADNRVDNAMKRIDSAKSKVNQQRLESFFQVKSVSHSTVTKRKVIKFLKT